MEASSTHAGPSGRTGSSYVRAQLRIHTQLVRQMVSVYVQLCVCVAAHGGPWQGPGCCEDGSIMHARTMAGLVRQGAAAHDVLN